MPALPRDDAFSSTLRLLADPDRFVSDRCAQHGSDVIETRIMLRRAVCVVEGVRSLNSVAVLL